MTAHIDRIVKESPIVHLLTSAAVTLPIGLLLGRAIYQVGMRGFYVRTLQDALLALPAQTMIGLSVIIPISFIARRLFPKFEGSSWSAFPIVVGALCVTHFSFESLTKRATAGQLLPAYIISGLTATCAALLVLAGIGGVVSAWKLWKSDKKASVANPVSN